MMNDIIVDEKIKVKLKEMKAPNELRDIVHKEICGIKPKKKKYTILKGMMQIAAAIMISVVFLGATAYTITSGRLNLSGLGVDKLYKNYDKNDSTKVNAVIENEYYKIILDTAYADNAYLVLDYIIELTEKGESELGEIKHEIKNDELHDNGYSLMLNNLLFANYDNTYKFIYGVAARCEKIEERKYSLVGVWNIADIETKKFEVELGLGDLFNYSDEYDWWHKPKIPIDKRITFNVTIPEDVEENDLLKEQVLSDKTRIVLSKIHNTKVATFINAKVIHENLNYKEYEELNDGYYSFVLIDNLGKEIPINSRMRDVDRNYFIKDQDGNKQLVEDIDVITKGDDTINIVVEENYVLSFGEVENLKDIKVCPTFTKFYYHHRSEWEKACNSNEWYPVIEGEEKRYFAQSGLGGDVEIYKIEKNEEGISFYYNEYGIVGNEITISLRSKEEKNKSILTGGPRFWVIGENGIGNKITFCYKGRIYWY